MIHLESQMVWAASGKETEGETADQYDESEEEIVENNRKDRHADRNDTRTPIPVGGLFLIDIFVRLPNDSWTQFTLCHMRIL